MLYVEELGILASISSTKKSCLSCDLHALWSVLFS